ncbi:Undecaprenyl pyrophosphate synthetase [Salinispira pacifica]|uniref:Isoprenyl transferase n=2 Tax=Salinispira pacifica TaxID=1307761 RepID=V5WGH6_9SPIO|nr:Undecaprenyl pyrophosphate synthetase [Salinispira pacifica]
MDGNGRWAREKGLPRTSGHNEGLKAAKQIVKAVHDAGISYLTLYTFSTENWKRTEEEVSFLMKLIKTSLRKEYEFYKENDIRVVHSGDLSVLPRDIQEEIELVEEDTSHFTSLVVNLAINYGGRDEIVRAASRALADNPALAQRLGEDHIRNNLDRPEIPDLDLIIRSGGEQRLSNFMLWRSSYAEIFFSQTLWPDFNKEEFHEILQWFMSRTRRYGGTT